MEAIANELSVYDKLSETVDLVRQTGHQCGMSEKAIEKFITQLLEKNEPQREPPQHPVLVAVYKVLLTLGLIVLAAYFMIQPFSPLAPEPTLSGAQSWRALIRHIRLVSLPITKKYLPESKGAALPATEEDRHFTGQQCHRGPPLRLPDAQADPGLRGPCPRRVPEGAAERIDRASPLLTDLAFDKDLDPWWPGDCERNESERVPANCTACAHSLPLEVTLPEDAPRTFDSLRQLVIKTGRPLLTEEIQRFLCRYPEVAEGFPEGLLAKWQRCFPERWFPFPYPWRRPLNRSQILRELFPVFTRLSFPKDASLKKCFLLRPEPVVGSKRHRVHELFAVGSGEAMLQLIPPFHCRRHCQSVAMPVEAGDIGYTSAAHWKAYVIARGDQPLVICDGATLSEL
ncbi:bombesin receptor-activated protein C6orf89 homolog isoform X1 [Fukomys damarensis]|uniref:bombesin receptor-activated protein C6orf89 homolog isoform X1 n=1 Tax=Fukomys damarensis TaxID=885580 RepID=UPI00053F3969|nr:bombesin receptor-activated protein C6orf89 homolog isoform X1 [Fukomys damarensis]